MIFHRPSWFGPAVLALIVTLAGCDASLKESDPPLRAPVADSRPVEPDTARMPLAFPTRNIGLLTGELDAFYMEVNRDSIAGLREAGWEGGQYGFVRGPVETSYGPRFTQLHEGIDIRPLQWDEHGEPQDTVRAAMAGRVAYINTNPGSAYGRYIVLEHEWDGAPVYTLYAHLNAVSVQDGAAVRRGQRLGLLGYTGRGIWRERAHVHFEVALMLNRNEPVWFDCYYGAQADQHGLYFGTNLAGVDVPALYRALAENPALSFRDFLRQQPPGYQIALPGDQPLDLLARYPWLWDGDTPPRTDRPGSWLVTFTREGVPMRIAYQDEPVTRPEVIGVSRVISRNRLGTNGILARGDDRYVITATGLRYFSLIATTEDAPAPW